MQCAYHGWEFGAGGACARIPQLPPGSKAAAALPRACATPLPSLERQGLLWAFPGGGGGAAAAAASPPAEIAELDDPDFLDATDFFMRDLPYSWDTLVENLLDPAHVPYAHHAIIRGADRAAGRPIPLAVRAGGGGAAGFAAERTDAPAGGRYRVSFRPPCLVYYEIESPPPPPVGPAAAGPPLFLGLGSYCVPTGPGCRPRGPARHISPPSLP